MRGIARFPTVRSELPHERGAHYPAADDPVAGLDPHIIRRVVGESAETWLSGLVSHDADTELLKNTSATGADLSFWRASGITCRVQLQAWKVLRRDKNF